MNLKVKYFIKKIDWNGNVIELKFEFDWVIVNDNLSSLCIVVYSKFLLEKILEATKKNKISDINRQYIYESMSKKEISVLNENETIDILKQIYKDGFE